MRTSSLTMIKSAKYVFVKAAFICPDYQNCQIHILKTGTTEIMIFKIKKHAEIHVNPFVPQPVVSESHLETKKQQQRFYFESVFLSLTGHTRNGLLGFSRTAGLWHKGHCVSLENRKQPCAAPPPPAAPRQLLRDETKQHSCSSAPHWSNAPHSSNEEHWTLPSSTWRWRNKRH